MSIKTIYTNGCSWTEGCGAETAPENKNIQDININDFAWPKYLGELMNCNVINEATGGGSNARILRQTIDYVTALEPEQRAETLIAIGWTLPDRDEIYIKGKYYRFNSAQPCSTFNDIKQNLTPKKVRQIDDYYWHYFMDVYDPEAKLDIYFRQIYLLKNLLENLSIPFIFFLGMPWKWETPTTLNAEEEKRHGKIVAQIASGTNGIDISASMSYYMHEHKLPMSPCFHPWPKSHKIWADHIFQQLVDRKIIDPKI
jgi:hypothetical protein